MVRPPQDAIDTFMSITGASETVAVQKLEEHHGDLNEAVNAHFNDGDRNTHAASAPPTHNDFMDIDEPIDVESSEPALPLLASARNLNPLSLPDPTFGLNIFDGGRASGLSSSVPQVSDPKEVREIPIEFKDGSSQPGSSGPMRTIEDVTDIAPTYGPETRETVIIDDDDDVDEVVPCTPPVHGSNGFNDGRRSGPSVTPLVDVSDYNNDIEEAMIQAAIEASRRDAETYQNQQFLVPDNSTGPQLHQKPSAMEDVEFERAVSLSLKAAERERAFREQGVQIGEQSYNSSGMQLEESGNVTTAHGRQGFVSSNTETSSQLQLEEGNPYVQEEAEDVEEQPLIRHRSRRIPSGNAESTESGQVVDSPQASPQRQPQLNGDAFERDEWGGISSEEHDEAVMLEAALFGGIPEGTAYRFAYPPHQMLQTGSDRNSSSYPQFPRSPSPTLTAQRLLREQQDDEYLAALQADKEKELKARQEAEAALEKERHQEEETRRKLLEEEEHERKLAVKEASLPQEPSSDNESAVTLLVRMPDGSRRGRRFLKSDKLKLLFDYIDVGRVVKPGTYRLVRPYPRRAFTDEEHESSLSELGLTSKQEALYLELI